MDDTDRIATRDGEVATEDGHGAAALAAVEILIWQLLRAGLVEAEPLALDLVRYGRLYDAERSAPSDAAAAQSLYALAGLARGAGRLCAGATRKRPPRPAPWKDSHVN
jgi:hypothetical protein